MKVVALRFRREVSTLDGSGAPERASPDEVNAALDRLLISEALARLTPEHRAVVQRSYFQGWTTAQIAADLGIADGTVSRGCTTHYEHCGCTARNGCHTMTFLHQVRCHRWATSPPDYRVNLTMT